MQRLRLAMVVCFALIALPGCRHSSSTATPSASDVTEFDSAVRDRDTDIVKTLIQAKPEMVNARDEHGKTPLTIATENGDQDMVKLLQKHGGHN